MKRILIAILMVALAALPAFASVNNVKVGGDTDSTIVSRDSFDLGDAVGVDGNGTAHGADNEQSLFITQTRLKVSADLSDNVSGVVQLINERPWGEEDTATSDEAQVSIDQAYAQYNEFLSPNVNVAIGRMPLRYGNAFIVGDPNTNNRVSQQSGLRGVAADLSKEKSFDAIKVNLDYNPLSVDIFGAIIDSNVNVLNEGQDDDVNLFGANANYKFGDSRNTEGEAYFFAKIDKSTEVGGGTAGLEPDSVYTPGLRASTNPISGLNVQGEVAWQFGNRATNLTAGAGSTTNDNQQRRAMAAQVISSYNVTHEKVAKWHPVLASWYTYLSGDTNASLVNDHTCSGPAGCANSAEQWTGWDPMMEDQSGGTIYNTLFDYTNAHIMGGSLQVTPIEDVIAKLSFTSLWVAQGLDESGGGIQALLIRQPDSTTRSVDATDNRHIGNEIDLDLVFNYTEDVQLGLSAGWFIPGELFDAPFDNPTGNDDTAKQVLVNADLAF